MDPLQLTSDEVQTWCVSLNVPSGVAAGLHATLTCDELSRSARLRFEPDRRRFIVAHGVLRDLLGRYLGTDPAHVRFVHNAFGKPELSSEFGDRLSFSLSHSADLALIAIAAAARIGVDVECAQAGMPSDYAAVAQCFFSAAEVDQLKAFPSHRHAQAFLSCWTKKEAYVKACGEGLSVPLTSFSVPLAADPAPVAVDLRGARWSLHTLQPAPGYLGALAIEGTGWRVHQRYWGYLANRSKRYASSGPPSVS